MASLFSGLTPGPSSDAPPFDAAFLARYRMAFYYTGVLANLIALALATEVTGGLAESPFVPLLVAFVLSAQQLSRFRTQAGVMFAAGLVAVTLMLLLDRFASDPPVPAPHDLVIMSVLLALAGGGWLSLREKPYNHYVKKNVQGPSQVHIYRDGRDAWRFVLYSKIHRQDPILLRTDGGLDGEFPESLKERLEERLFAMGEAGGWEEFELIWPQRCTGSFAVAISRKTEI